MTDVPGDPRPRRRRLGRRDGDAAEPPTDKPRPSPVPGPRAEPADAGRVRKRRRRGADEPDTPGTPAPSVIPPAGNRTAADRRGDQSDRSLRGLVTTRSSQIPWSAATRARSVAVPTPEDLAEAEAEIQIVRRNYTPTEPLRAGRADVGSRLRRGKG